MTYEEALGILLETTMSVDKENEALEKAIEALKKQIPEKPEIDEFEGIDYWWGRYLHRQDSCPYCGIRLDTHFDYCCNCGQALNWSDEK